jgi:Holliday junction DNA helicase RuvB
MVGQDRLRGNLAVFISAAKGRGECLDHLLFYGPPGLGKTSLARIVAREMNAQFRATSGPVLERASDLAALLSNLEADDVLFIDEIHRLPPAVEEVLYPAMEDFQLDLLIGQGPSARSLRIDLPRFTLVGATTRAGLLTSPLRDRFGWSARLDYYPTADLVGVLTRSAKVLGIALAPDAAGEIAQRSRGTPRIANRLLRRVRDFSAVQHGADAAVGADIARYALERLDVDAAGFDKLDRALLLALIEKFAGGPVGVETLVAALSEDRGTLEELVEPFLIQGGFLDRTPRGRVATRRAYDHLGIAPPAGGAGQGHLF